MLRAYQDAVAGEVARFEGHVAKFMGDGVLAYFGWPRRTRTTAERAVRAGLAIAAAVARAAGARGRAAGRPGRDRDRARRGRRPDRRRARRARRPSSARPRTWRPGCRPWPSRARWSSPRPRAGCWAACSPCATSGRGRLKGFAEPVRAFAVAGEGAAESRFEALHGRRALAPAGRPRARAGAAARPLGAGEGRRGPGRAALGRARHRQVAAGPGAARAARGRAAHRAGQFCSPYHANTRLHPVIGQLERAAGLRREDPPAAQLDRLEALLAPRGRRRREAAPRPRRRCSASRPATATRRSTSARSSGRSGPSGHCSTSSRAWPARAGAGALRGRPLGRPDHAGADRPRGRAGAAPAGAGPGHLPARVPAALDGHAHVTAALAGPARAAARRRRWSSG